MEDLEKLPVYPALSEIYKLSKDDLDYFIKRGNNIRLFMNSKYVPVSGGTPNLDNKVAEIRKNANKIGFALHAFDPVFKEATFSQNVKNVVKSLGYRKPIVCQSMYVLKQGFSEPNAPGHQDSTFLLTEPDTLIGLWVAMEDCTPENGCLKFIPGSHKSGLKRRFARQMTKTGEILKYTDTNETANYDPNQFVSVPIKAGSAILMNGRVVHKSTSENTPVSRDVFVCHIYDGDVSIFSEKTWMNFTPVTFRPLFQGNA